MRPTYLQFRSPKESTPSPYDSQVNAHGKRLSYEPKSRKSTFGRDKRFREYDLNARKVGPFVGPSSYKTNQKAIGTARIRGGPSYKCLHNDIDVTDNSFFFVGNHLVNEPAMVSKKSHVRSVDRPRSRPRSARPQSAVIDHSTHLPQKVLVVDERKTKDFM